MDLKLTAFIDLVTMDPTLGRLCVDTKTPYLGLACTKELADWLTDELGNLIFQDMASPESDHYDASVAKILNKVQGIQSLTSLRTVFATFGEGVSVIY